MNYPHLKSILEIGVQDVQKNIPEYLNLYVRFIEFVIRTRTRVEVNTEHPLEGKRCIKRNRFEIPKAPSIC